MVAPLAMPVSSGSSTLLHSRHRPTTSERVLQTKSALRKSEPEEEAFEPLAIEPEHSADPQHNQAADFAAAVIVGASAPAPQSMDELLRRIVSKDIPTDTQARLKDLLA